MDYSCGITTHNTVGWNVLGYDSIGRYYHTVTNCDTWQDSGLIAYPNITANENSAL